MEGTRKDWRRIFWRGWKRDTKETTWTCRWVSVATRDDMGWLWRCIGGGKWAEPKRPLRGGELVVLFLENMEKGQRKQQRKGRPLWNKTPWENARNLRWTTSRVVRGQMGRVSHDICGLFTTGGLLPQFPISTHLFLVLSISFQVRPWEKAQCARVETWVRTSVRGLWRET